MTTEQDDKELEKDLDEPEETEEKVETPEPPLDPNEPIEVVTADAQKQARRERRAQRQSEFRAAQEERDRLRRENEELRARSYQPPPQQQQQPHPAATRLQQIDAAEKQLHDHYRARASQPDFNPNGPEYAEFERKNRELQTARMAVIAAAQAPQINEEELIRKAQLRMYLNEHSDISHDPTKWQWAYARWQQYRAEGKEDTRELSDAVFEEARRRFGLKTRSGGSPAADPATRQRYSGVPSRGAGPGPATAGAIQMGPHEKKMARIAFSHLPEKEAYQHWANTVGKKLQEQKSKGG